MGRVWLRFMNCTQLLTHAARGCMGLNYAKKTSVKECTLPRHFCQAIACTSWDVTCVSLGSSGDQALFAPPKKLASVKEIRGNFGHISTLLEQEASRLFPDC